VQQREQLAKLVAHAHLGRRSRWLVAQILGQLDEAETALAQIGNDRRQGFSRVNAAPIDVEDEDIARFGERSDAPHKRIAALQRRRVAGCPRPVHDLVAKAFRQR